MDRIVYAFGVYYRIAVVKCGVVFGFSIIDVVMIKLTIPITTNLTHSIKKVFTCGGVFRYPFPLAFDSIDPTMVFLANPSHLIIT